MNSGAEAVESAIKSVRKWGYEVKGAPDGQAEIIVCADNFHGRSLGIIGFGTDVAPASISDHSRPGFRALEIVDHMGLRSSRSSWPNSETPVSKESA
jgi:ornithine--oxo-acid transaminase